ncbi:MAG: hypothetical protein AW12_00046 [Candidatus Accumulibacter sp. BA-94]|nr:MAG: hypothetical protein AW12_00046 [Candidatus Accumulibacter sp. BA-94]
MATSPPRLPLVDLRVDDAEIGLYAALLDSLGLALLAFAADGSLRLASLLASARGSVCKRLCSASQGTSSTCSQMLRRSLAWPPAACRLPPRSKSAC